jgi:hypothetical protein
MAYFDDIFKQSLEELKRLRESNSKIRNALQKYEGRSLHLVVGGDAEYLFSIDSGEIEYQVNPEQVPDDIYVEMDLPLARRIIEEKRFGVFDVLRVKYRNVTGEDIDLVRTLFWR